jgi:uncharacterized membrane protein YhhN
MGLGSGTFSRILPRHTASKHPMTVTRLSSSQLWLCFALSAGLYLLSLALSLPVFIDAPLKVLPVACLFIMAGFARRIPMYLKIALLFSACGDLLLALPIANGFIYGLSAFLLAQLSYAAGFFKNRQRPINTQRKRRLFFVLCVSLGLATVILPNTGELLLPVAVYLTAIAAMAAGASLHGSTQASIFCGALLFVLSDALIAINKFLWPFTASHLAIMTTYYAAQALIVWGVMRYHQRR